MLRNFWRIGCSCLWRRICHVWPGSMARHMCMFTGRPARSVCVSAPRTDLAWNDQRRDNHVQPNRTAYLFLCRARRVCHTVNGVRHRAVLLSRSPLFADRPVVVPERSQSSFIGKVAVFRPFGSLDELSKRRRHHVSFFAAPVRHEHMYENLNSHPVTLEFLSSRRYENVNDESMSHWDLAPWWSFTDSCTISTMQYIANSIIFILNSQRCYTSQKTC